MTFQTTFILRQWVFSVAHQWRKLSAPLVIRPYRVNPAAQGRATASLQWRRRSEHGVTPLRAGSGFEVGQS